MEHYFFATLTAVVQLSKEEFELLFSAAEQHYDFKVHATTEEGGVLYGSRNRRNFAEELGKQDNNIELTERQLGLMMKALEMTSKTAAIDLFAKFLNIAKDLQQRTVQVNKPLNNIEFVGQFIVK